MVDAEKVASIRAKAEVLAGHSLGDTGDALTELAAQLACAFCQRTDIPVDMEGAVAALVVSLCDGGGAIKSVKRGDTAVSYDTAKGILGTGVCSVLSPWRRLGRLREDKA